MLPNRYSGKFREDARLALAYAIEALADAERAHVDETEILRISEEVIRRRVRLRIIELDAGNRPGVAARRQLRRDVFLLREPAPVSLLFDSRRMAIGAEADSADMPFPASPSRPEVRSDIQPRHVHIPQFGTSSQDAALPQ
jgi:hypothetical protein